MSKMGNP